MPNGSMITRFTGRPMQEESNLGVASTYPTVSTSLLMGDKKKKKKSMLSGRLSQMAANKGGLGGYATLSERNAISANR